MYSGRQQVLVMGRARYHPLRGKLSGTVQWPAISFRRGLLASLTALAKTYCRALYILGPTLTKRFVFQISLGIFNGVEGCEFNTCPITAARRSGKHLFIIETYYLRGFSGRYCYARDRGQPLRATYSLRVGSLRAGIAVGGAQF
jgi:hypothetical protein